MSKRTNNLARSRPRIRILLIATAIVFTLCAGQAFKLQALDAQSVAAEAADQITVSRTIPALRGEIVDRNGEVLAYSEPTVNVVADPEMIRTNGKFDQPMTDEDKTVAATAADRIAKLMAADIGGSAKTYLPALTKPKLRYSVVAKGVSPQAFSKLQKDLKEAELIGLYSESAPTRRYPGGTLASNVLGFVGVDDKTGATKGASGLELELNKTLEGVDGKEAYETSPNGRIPTGTNTLVPAVNGQDYQLTLDAGLQMQVEQILANRVTTARADWGTAVVMDINTGEVLSLANYPTFDSNEPSKAKAANRGNRAVTDPYTPGSVEKTLTFAAMLDQGIITPKTVLTVPGRVKSGSQWVNDAWVHGPMTMYAQGVIAKSSNVGTILLARQMPKKTLHDYLTAFGLGQKTGIGLPGEANGILPDADMPDPNLLALIDSLNGSSIGSGGAATARNVLSELAWGHVTPEDRPLFVATMNAYLGANFNQVRLAGVKNAGNNQDYDADVDLFREKGTGDTVSLQTLLDLVNELQEPSSENAVDCDGVGAYPIQELRDAAISLLLRNGSRAVAEGAITESGNLAQLLATVEVVIEEGKKIPGYTPQWASGGKTGILNGLDHNGRIERWVPPVTQ